MLKPCKIVKFSKELDQLFNAMKEASKEKRWLLDMRAMLLEDMYRGNRFEKYRIPPYYLVNYGVHNLYRYPHPEDYRSMYTIKNEGTEEGGYPLVIDFMPHNEYEKRFGYDHKR